MGTYSICLYKEVDKKYTNLKTTELLDSALIRVCVVIRLNTASPQLLPYPELWKFQAVIVYFQTYSTNESQDISSSQQSSEGEYIHWDLLGKHLSLVIH